MKRLITKIRSKFINPIDCRIIFVIGTGRSGTHWLGYTLNDHPEIHVSIEKPKIFNKVTVMALNFNEKTNLLPQLINDYLYEYTLTQPKLYADKSHPNIWLADDLIKFFPKAKFLGIQRNPYATVASMLKHRGVLSWIENWKQFPTPNPFLGISEENECEYNRLPLASKCALRWKSHRQRMDQLRTSLGNSLLVIEYEKLITETALAVAQLTEFLELEKPIPIPQIKRESLDRWRSELSSNTIAEIAHIVGEYITS